MKLDLHLFPYLIVAIVIWGAVTALSLWALRQRRNDVADIFWGPGFVLAGIAAAAVTGFAGVGLSEALMLGAVTLWAARLAMHIGRRFLHESREDARYRRMREGWGESWRIQSYLKVFVLQGVLLYLVALPLTKSMIDGPRDLSLLIAVGLAVWGFGFLFESIADEQLRRFKANPASKGRLMDQGLWSWSRHPNYFGEVVQWWGLFLMSPFVHAPWLIVSPLLITFLILKVSGVSLLEAAMADRPGYAEYRRRVSEFFPRPPRT